MSCYSGPNEVKNGCVLYYDMNNTQKSFKGAPTVNLLSNPTNEVIGTTSEFVQYADLAPIFNTYGTGVTYSLSLDLKAKIPGSMLVYMQNGSSSKYSFVNQSVAVGTSYQRYTFNGLSAAISTPTDTAATLAFYGTYGTGCIPSIKNVQVEIQPFATPFVNGTRSNTQSLLDLTNNNTLTSNSLTYASNNTFSFNGTSDSITNSTTAFNRVNGDAMTVACWMKPGRLAGQYQDIVVNRSDASYNWMLYQHATDGSIQLHGANQNKSSYVPMIGNWIYVAATVDSSGNSLLYINGTVQQTVTGYSYNNATPGLLCIGKFGIAAEYYLGSISSVNIYNRALSATEVIQNFNALRGRYGL